MLKFCLVLPISTMAAAEVCPMARGAISRRGTALWAMLLLAVCTVQPALARTQSGAAANGDPPASKAAAAAEQRAARAFDRAKGSPLDLHAFLERMPKGGDLHLHLSGAVYAETMIADAVADGLCFDPVHLSLLKPDRPATGTPPGPKTASPECATGALPVAAALKDFRIYDGLIDSFSMRAFVPSAGVSGHDHFFTSFDRMNGISKHHAGEWLDEVATRAAAQNEQYVEVMQSPDFSRAARLGREIGWPESDRVDEHGAERRAPNSGVSQADQDLAGTDPATLAKLRDELLRRGLREEVAANRAELATAQAQRNRIEHCGQPDALPGCSVKVRWIYQVLRAFPPEQVFAQTLLGFEVASSDPDVVGINFVQAEDRREAMAEYGRQMRMIGFLHTLYPRVHITLHAGELAPGLVPPAGLRFHIREAIDIAHAERIGHGVDVMYEDDPRALLKEMAERHIMVEINFTSNDVILGVRTNEHSFPEYRAAGVPVALSTDDEGVSRIDLTHEYVRAVEEFGVSYGDLKTMARTSLEHAFLPGSSLWKQPDRFTVVQAACASASLGSENPGGACSDFLRANPRAAEQWELEHRFRTFESLVP